jgi:hypothetical protein
MRSRRRQFRTRLRAEDFGMQRLRQLSEVRNEDTWHLPVRQCEV